MMMLEMRIMIFEPIWIDPVESEKLHMHYGFITTGVQRVTDTPT
ncbi:MAG: hypothetical protein CG440_1785, partial [Methanosaeta sp. NSM2]